jgi:hypothetical protein
MKPRPETVLERERSPGNSIRHAVTLQEIRQDGNDTQYQLYVS